MLDHLSFHLSDDYVDSYAERPVKWGFPMGAAGDTLGEFIFVTKYARKKPDGTKERWHEACRRVVEGMFSIQKDHCLSRKIPWNANKAQRSAEEAYDRMFEMKWLPPGRGIQHMGTPFVWEEGSAALQNCFAGDEEFITQEHGVVSFEDVVGEIVHVKTLQGWKKAEVNYFGVQDVQRVTFAPAHPNPRGNGFRSARSNHRVSVTVTPNHRWVLKGGGVTEELGLGDVVESHPGHPYRDGSVDHAQGLMHGLIFGDGTRSTFTYKSGLKQFHIRLCGAKAQQHLQLFENVTYPDSYDGDPWAYVASNDDLKDFPTGKSDGYMRGFLQGWIDADGSQTASGSWLLCSQHPGAQQWLDRNACLAGWILRGVNRDSVDTTNYGPRSNPMMRFTLSQGDDLAWKVVEVESLPEPVPVYCATVPEVGTFTLASGVYTGNCAFISTKTLGPRNPVQPFGRLMEMSMLGIGVGFDTEGAGKLTIHEPTGEPIIFVVPDSREGWVKSQEVLLHSYFVPGQRPVEFDYSPVRPEGMPLKRFGGYSAGPQPLMQLHSMIRAVLDSRIGQHIDSETITDIMNMEGHCVVAGSSRRSAELAIGQADDKVFLNLKNPFGNARRLGFLPDEANSPISGKNGIWKDHPEGGWGYMSNNSVVTEVGGNYDHIAELVAINGEPGMFYRDLARAYGRLVDPPNNNDRRVMGLNPCVTSDTWVMTSGGPRRVSDLIGIRAPVLVDGKPFDMESNGFFSTGERPVLGLTMDDGRVLKVTGEHPIMTTEGWVDAEDLCQDHRIILHDHDGIGWDGHGTDDEGYLLGLFVGDGSFMGAPGAKRAVLCSWGDTEGSVAVRDRARTIMDSMPHRADWKGWTGPFGNGWHRMSSVALTNLAAQYGVVHGNKKITDAVQMASSRFTQGFLSGLFDADGHVEGSTAKGVSIRLSQSDIEMLRMVQQMLGRLGVRSVIRPSRPAGTRDLPGGEYECNSSWRLIVSGAHTERFMDRVGFTDTDKISKYERLRPATFYDKPLTTKLVHVRELGTMPTYDVTVNDVHAFDAEGVYVSNCAEQTLEDQECCTLVEVFPTRCDDEADYLRTLKFAYLYAKSVTLMPTHWPETNEVMRRNRRIGTSMTGVAQFADLYGWTQLRKWCDAGYHTIERYDESFSEWFGERRSIKTTSVKPSGTVSLLAGVWPGVHWPVAAGSYIRRVREKASSVIVDVIRDAGYLVEADVKDPNFTVVFSFPVIGPEGRSEREVPVWEKVHLAATMQCWWADNAVSATFTFLPSEASQIASVIKAFEGQLKTLSFLPLGEAGVYPQMPYERVDDDVFHEAYQKVSPIDWDRLYAESEEGADEKFCTTDQCEIKL